MSTEPQLSVILTTYQRPAHLERCLHCLTLQQGMDGKFEVIVADDGSQDGTEQIVRSVTRTVAFPVKWVTHPHHGFRAALCRNDGVRASSAPYLLFVDCDCLFPRDHLQKHLLARRPGIVRAGHCLRLDQAATERVDKEAIETEEYRDWISREERKRFLQHKIKNHYYQLIRHSTKPKLIAYDFGIAREDFEAVNGFDEAFVGWGCEDDDLAYRLRRAGRRIQSALEYTHGYHMWHPTEPSRPALWKLGTNVLRMFAPQRPIQCSNGLVSTGDDSPDVSTSSSAMSLNISSSSARSAA